MSDYDAGFNLLFLVGIGAVVAIAIVGILVGKYLL